MSALRQASIFSIVTILIPRKAPSAKRWLSPVTIICASPSRAVPITISSFGSSLTTLIFVSTSITSAVLLSAFVSCLISSGLVLNLAAENDCQFL